MKKIKKINLNELDVYEEDSLEEKEGPLEKISNGIKRMWNKTVFPEKLKNRKEERQLKRQIEHEAKMEAIKESKDLIKEKKKADIVDKSTGKKKKDFLQKLAEGFGAKEGTKFDTSEKISRGMGLGTTKVGGKNKIEDMLSGSNVSSGSNEKINRMLDRGNTSGNNNDKLLNMLGSGKSNVGNSDKINAMLGKASKKENNEDKIKRMLGR